MRVLVPLDGSERSLAAMETGLAMLAPGKPEVTLMAVQHGGFENAPDDIVEEFAGDHDDEIFPTADSCKVMLDAAAKRISKLGLKPKQLVVEGKVIANIVKAAAGHDVIVMHALNKSGFMEKLRLSGTEQIARKVQCSVLLVAD